MERALSLAKKAAGNTSPNPMVGAVIIKAGKIIAEGYHKKAGADHAEIAALKKAKKEAKGSALYVTLEPCPHTGKTSACTKAIISAGVKTVVVATKDPNPLVAGKGIAELKKAGIAVKQGLLQKEAQRLNEAFNKFITQKTPFVTMKAAGSLDGKIAATNGDSRWITNELSRKRVHEMRNEADAVMVGVNTVIKDDPQLNVRPVKKGVGQPLRIVVDTNLKTPLEAKALNSAGGKVIIAAGETPSQSKVRALEAKGAMVLKIKQRGSELNLKELMKALAALNVVSVLIEGGSTLFTSALSEGVVDKVALFYAPILLGGSSRYSIFEGKGVKKVSEAIKIKNAALTRYGEDILVEGYL